MAPPVGDTDSEPNIPLVTVPPLAAKPEDLPVVPPEFGGASAPSSNIVVSVTLEAFTVL
ncbi:hypothetical protein [Flavivirga rizhaonensis]|uniref:hypothetical protein n=1 Tax=Flavivirga rizhaonensis TaxID=2559571 RepID=UPI001FE7CDD4|nr:hypothetical protein [Flavivirga rizhaonensis]